MPKYDYETKKEAEEVLEEARKEWKHFCPAISDMCRRQGLHIVSQWKRL